MKLVVFFAFLRRFFSAKEERRGNLTKITQRRNCFPTATRQSHLGLGGSNRETGSKFVLVRLVNNKKHDKNVAPTPKKAQAAEK